MVLSRFVHYALGVATGLVADRVLQSDAARQTLDRAQHGIREAAVSGLEAVERGSAKIRRHLAPAPRTAASAPTPAAGKRGPRKTAASTAKSNVAKGRTRANARKASKGSNLNA